MRDLAFLCMWLIVWPLSFYYSQVGVLVWIWVALLAPESYLYGFLSGAPINKLVAASTLIAIFVGNGVRRLYLDGILFTLTVFVFHMGFSYFFSVVDTDVAASIFDKMTKIVVFSAVLCLVMDSRIRLHSSLVALALALGTVALWEGTLLILTAGGHHFEGRSALGDNNHVAVALLMLLPVLIYLQRWSASRLARLCFATVAAFDVLAVIASNSRGGFVGLLIVGLFYLAGARTRGLALSAIFAAAILIYSVAPPGWMERINTISNAEEDTSFMGRVVAWKISTLIALDHPIFGGGPHAVQIPAVWSEYARDFELLDFVASPPPGPFPRAAHSIWFEVLGDLGFAGLFIFLIIVFLTIRYCNRVSMRARRYDELEWAVDLAKALRISVFAYLIAGSAVSMAYSEIFYIFVALVSCMNRTVTEFEQTHSKTAQMERATVSGRNAAPQLL